MQFWIADAEKGPGFSVTERVGRASTKIDACGQGKIDREAI
jgi:hypothetical protein